MTVNKGKENFDSDVQWFLQHLLCLNYTTNTLILYYFTAKDYFSVSCGFDYFIIYYFFTS